MGTGRTRDVLNNAEIEELIVSGLHPLNPIILTNLAKRIPAYPRKCEF